MHSLLLRQRQLLRLDVKPTVGVTASTVLSFICQLQLGHPSTTACPAWLALLHNLPVRGEVHEAHDMVPVDFSPHDKLITVQRAIQGNVWPFGAK